MLFRTGIQCQSDLLLCVTDTESNRFSFRCQSLCRPRLTSSTARYQDCLFDRSHVILLSSVKALRLILSCCVKSCIVDPVESVSASQSVSDSPVSDSQSSHVTQLRLVVFHGPADPNKLELMKDFKARILISLTV